MALFVDGKKVGSVSNPSLVYDKIERLIMDRASCFDISILSEEELSYIKLTMYKMSVDYVSSILSKDPLSGLDMNKVFDINIGGNNVKVVG